MRRVLVTGGAGFMGSGFVHHLLAVDPAVQVVTLDALTYAGNQHNLENLPDPGRHTFVRGDIADAALVRRVFADFAPDTLVHFAAETHVDRSILEPERFLHANVVGTFSLLEAARAAWKGCSDVRFHHVSTDEVYGSLEPEAAPWTEDAPYRPSSPYSATKAASDHLVRAWGHTYGLPVTTTLSANNYGPRQYPEKLIPLMVSNAVAGQPLPIYGDGQQVREWLHVDDHSAAVLAVLARGRPGEVYHVSSSEPVTNLELIRGLCTLLDRRLPAGAPYARLIQLVADRPGHDRRYGLDARRLQRDTGWRPRWSLERGLEATIAWYLNNGAWIEAVRAAPEYQSWLRRNYVER